MHGAEPKPGTDGRQVGQGQVDHFVATHMTEAGWACGPGLGGENGSTGTQERELSKGGGVLPPSLNTPDSLALREGGYPSQMGWG